MRKGENFIICAPLLKIAILYFVSIYLFSLSISLQELDLHDFLSFDAELGRTLQELQAIVHRKKYMESMGGHSCEEVADLRFRGARIEDLCLDFTLPGYPDYALKPGEENVLYIPIECIFIICSHDNTS